MIALFLLATLSVTGPEVQPLALFAQDPVTEEVSDEPDAKTIEAALDALKMGFGKGTETPEHLAAVEAAASVPCKEIARALGKYGLKDKDVEVAGATLLVLAKMDTPEALDQLIGFHKKDRRLKDDEELLAATLRAIAWHGDPKTIDILAKDLFTDASKSVIRARVLGLGRIRSMESVEALMGIMKSAARNKIQPFMDDLSLSLAVLTGVDNGKNQDRWIAWWNDNKRELEIAEEPPVIDKQLQRKWNYFWGVRNDVERDEKREDRGGDGS